MILTILQARTQSTRLPGKIFKQILGEPLIFRQLERMKRSKSCKKIVVATTDHQEDDSLASWCVKQDVDCYRGSSEDVLDRFYQAALRYNPEHLIRITSDCPLIDPDLIDRVVEFHLNGNYDFTSSSSLRTFPEGLEVEVCRFTVLQKAWRDATSKRHREHVMPFIYQNPERFKLGFYIGTTDLSRYRLVVDYEVDYQLVTKIYQTLYPQNPAFTTSDVLTFLQKNPQLVSSNAQHLLKGKGDISPEAWDEEEPD